MGGRLDFLNILPGHLSRFYMRCERGIFGEAVTKPRKELRDEWIPRKTYVLARNGNVGFWRGWDPHEEGK